MSTAPPLFAPAGLPLPSFGEDPRGELYVLAHGCRVYRPEAR